MEWPYSLNVNLNEEQQANRRRLLDAYGQFAQLSVLLLPLFYQLSVALRLLLGRVFVRNPSKLVKNRQGSVALAQQKPRSSISTGGWQWINWVLHEEAIQGWGTWQQLILAFAWTLWLLFLATKNTGNDYLHLTRRFGIIAASQLPINYVLAMKSWSPIQYITRMSHEELNPYHRLLGRIIVLFMACHAILYTNFYIQKGFLWKRIQDRDVILGLCAVSSAIILFTTALARVRAYNYRLFFYLHVLLAIMILPILYFHVSHIRPYILEACAIFMLLIVQRKVDKDDVYATISRCNNTNLVSISASLKQSKLSRSYAPGQHIYLSFPEAKEKLRLNPFTVANHPNQDRKVEIVARVLDGTTSMLDQLASRPQPVPLILEGPYGGAKYFPDLSGYDSVLLLAGGVGATFTLPIYQQLLKLEDRIEKKVKFAWVVKHLDEAAWGIRRLASNSMILPKSFDLCITGRQGNKKGSANLTAEDEAGDIQLHEKEGLLSGTSTDISELDSITKGRVRYGRPNLKKLVDDAFPPEEESKVAILVCGPTGMGSALRKEVGRWIGSGRDIFWHNEEFGW